MSFAALELAGNPDVQQRLRAEVDAALELGGGHLDYEAVQGLSYMDMVVSGMYR
jgi:cytochrome P450 family 6